MGSPTFSFAPALVSEKRVTNTINGMTMGLFGLGWGEIAVSLCKVKFAQLLWA